MRMVGEILEELRMNARRDRNLRVQLLQTRFSEDPLKEFCEVSTRNGYPLAPMELVIYGEESYAAMRRSTNGGGENSPLLAWSDDYYELMMAELEEDETLPE